MLKIMIVKRKNCIKWYHSYILPDNISTLPRKRCLGVFISQRYVATNEVAKDKHCIIYVAGGNGLRTFRVLIHELLHYINFMFFNKNKKFDKWLDRK